MIQDLNLDPNGPAAQKIMNDFLYKSTMVPPIAMRANTSLFDSRSGEVVATNPQAPEGWVTVFQGGKPIGYRQLPQGAAAISSVAEAQKRGTEAATPKIVYDAVTHQPIPSTGLIEVQRGAGEPLTNIPAPGGVTAPPAPAAPGGGVTGMKAADGTPVPTPDQSPFTGNPWVDAHILAESDGKWGAVSRKGATGPIQVLPSTAAQPGPGVRPADPNNPQDVLRAGIDYRNQQLNATGDPALAAIAYNMGPDNYRKWVAAGADPKKLPAETRQYVSDVMVNHGLLATGVTVAPRGATPTAAPSAAPPITPAAAPPTAGAGRGITGFMANQPPTTAPAAAIPPSAQQAVVPELPAGVPQSMIGQHEQMVKQWTDINAANQASEGIIAKLATIKALAPQAMMGGELARRDYFNSLLDLVNVKGATDAKTASDLVDQNANQIVAALRMGAFQGGSDALQGLIQAGKPNRTMTLDAIQHSADMLIAAQRVNQARANYLVGPYTANNAQDFINKQLQFDNNADPRAFHLNSLQGNAVLPYLKTLSDSDVNAVNAKRNTLRNMGALQ
jgi:hypothetical protein